MNQCLTSPFRLRRMALNLFRNDLAGDRAQQRRNAEKWLQAVQYLGDRWVGLPMNRLQ